MYSYTKKLYVQLYNLVVCTSELVLSSTLTSLVAFPHGIRKSGIGNMYKYCVHVYWTSNSQNFPWTCVLYRYFKKVQDINCTLCTFNIQISENWYKVLNVHCFKVFSTQHTSIVQHLMNWVKVFSINVYCKAFNEQVQYVRQYSIL